MIENSAFVTIGEPKRVLDAIAEGRAPRAEYAVLREGHFSKTVAVVDQPAMGSKMTAGLGFAFRAYRATWAEENVYLGEEFPGIEYLAVHALLRRRKRIAMLVHNVASLRRRLPLVTFRLGRLVDHFLCLSEQSKRELEGSYGVDASRITVIGSRVDTEFFTPSSSAAGEPLVCSAGAVNRDYATLIAAVEPLGITTKIAADTAWRYSTKEQVVGELPACVEMRSWGSYVNLRELYGRATLVVVPLKRSMMSGVTVALEAMAMGKPILLTDSPYVHDFLRHGEHGFFVPPGDPDALRERIRYLVDRPEEAKRMGERAREWVLERFTVERYVERILSVWPASARSP